MNHDSVFLHDYVLRPWRTPEGRPVRFAHKSTYENPRAHRLHMNQDVELFLPVTPVDYLVAGQMYHLRQGDLLPIGPHTVHAAVPHPRQRYERFYIVMPPAAMAPFADDPLEKLLRSGRLSRPFRLPEDRWAALHELLREAEERCQADCGGWSGVEAFFTLTRVFAEAARDLAADTALPPPSHLPAVTRAVLDYVDAHFPDVDRVSDIADATGFSLPYLSGRFHETVGVSVTDYLTARKIAAARALLEQGADVTETCYASGFHDCSYFINKFKACTGMTPLAYQKKKT